MRKIIIGIHGLKNKPEKNILEKWWKKSIQEGLQAWGYFQPNFEFKLVYWADILHPKPLDLRIKNEKHPLYLSCPYVPGKEFINKKPSKLKQKVLDYLEQQMDKIFLNEDLSINFSAVSDLVIRHYFQDLSAYYAAKEDASSEQKGSVQAAIRNRLAEILYQFKHRQILLIAHSMGSIIAYDVLHQLAADVKIDTLITIGSPLGMPIVLNKLASEQPVQQSKLDKLSTPDNIERNWFNHADLRDMVAINYNLADEFAQNKNSVKPVDKIVYNNFEYAGEKYPHKAYGYLRTAEMAAAVNDFLNADRSRFSLLLRKWLSKVVGNFNSF